MLDMLPLAGDTVSCGAQKEGGGGGGEEGGAWLSQCATLCTTQLHGAQQAEVIWTTMQSGKTYLQQ